MSRHLALDPREPPVSVTLPRQGQARSESPDDALDLDESPGDPAEPGSGRRLRRGGRRDEQSLPTLRPAARHHSGVERRALRAGGKQSEPARAHDLEPRGMRLGKAMLALLGSAVAATAAGAWAYHSWDGNRVLSHRPGGSTSDIVLLDAIADTSQVSFAPGRSVVVKVQVDNRNQGTVNVSSIVPKPVTLSQSVPAGCDPGLVSVLAPSVDNLAIPPGGAVFNASVTMRPDAPSDCTGIAFAISFVVQGRYAHP
jgi:hypothetical protein